MYECPAMTWRRFLLITLPIVGLAVTLGFGPARLYLSGLMIWLILSGRGI